MVRYDVLPPIACIGNFNRRKKLLLSKLYKVNHGVASLFFERFWMNCKTFQMPPDMQILRLFRNFWREIVRSYLRSLNGIWKFEPGKDLCRLENDFTVIGGKHAPPSECRQWINSYVYGFCEFALPNCNYAFINFRQNNIVGVFPISSPLSISLYSKLYQSQNRHVFHGEMTHLIYVP